MYTLITLGLAAWCLSNLLVDEAGPNDILLRFRYWVGVRYDDASQPYGLNWVAEALTCIRCTSVWVGAFLTLLYALFPDVMRYVATALALSAITVVVDHYLDR